MNRHVALIPVIAVVAMALLGCTAHPKRVECEGHLQPINPVASAPTSAETVR